MRLYGYTIRTDSHHPMDRFEERGGFQSREARDLAAKAALRYANRQRAPGAERYTVCKWHSGSVTVECDRPQSLVGPMGACPRGGAIGRAVSQRLLKP